ncbi:MAG: amidohydrolase [Proteobacteria bacterium]|nr:amidohydrolase [Pseudomonadota bacterium]
MHQDILINNVTLLPLADGQTEIIASGFLSIKDGNITALGPMAEIPAAITAEKTIDGAGCLLMPGLVNTHTHAPMTLFRGLADDLELMTWLNEHIFPAEANSVNPEMVYWCSKLAAVEMILAGTTTVADGYFLEDRVAQAFADCGLRAVAAQGVIDFPAPGVPDPAKNVEAAAVFIDAWQDRNDLVTPAIFCHSPYTCSPETLKRAKEMTRQKNVKLFVHVAETEAEVKQIQEQHNTTPVRYLNSLGILDRHTICVHCVWLDDEEMEILARSNATVSTCPQSNMKLGAGIAPLKELLSRNIPVGLGTDGCASNNTLDLFQEMDRCAKLHKVKDLDPTALPAGQILQMATRGGAEILGLQEKIGSLAPGKAADLVLLDLQQPHLQPFYSQDLLVYAANGADVSSVIINGRLVVENRRILTSDVQEIMDRVRELARSL